MAMLAEKRHKVRGILNPRQTAWSKDSKKFGQQYMEKMGWKAGQGIGANLQGCTEPVKVSIRSDNRGVGFKDIPEDVLPHQNNYSDLLAQLATNNPPAVANADEAKSLELKSRQSRARVHYHKFTRSKDLSTYSQNDLDCILGKTTEPAKRSVEDSVENEPNFIHRGNMDSYFKEKSKSNYTSLIAEGDKLFKEEEEDSLYIGFGFSHVIKDFPHLYSKSSENSDSREELNESVKKSRKKNKTSDQKLDKSNSDFSIGDCTDRVQPMENEQELHESGKISNRKQKKNGWDVELPENCFAQLGFRETVCHIDKEADLHQNMKMSKRKRRKVDQSEEVPESGRFYPQTDNNEVVQPLENDEELIKASKKSKKKWEKNYQSVELPETCLNEEEFNVKIKKSKKKRKTGDECVEVPEIESCLLQSLFTKTQPLETEKEPNVNFKKSKKRRKNEVPPRESCPQTDFIETIGDFSETVSLERTEKENKSRVSTSKNKKKENTLLSDNSNDLKNVPINHETLKNMSSNHELKHKKEKKKVKGNDMIIELESQNNDTVESIQKRQNTIKSVRFSDSLMSVLLIPSRGQLESKSICFDNNYEPENCDISLDLHVGKCNQMTKTPVVEDQPSNLTEVADKPNVFGIRKTSNQSNCSPKNITKSSKIVVNGVAYTNGISEYNHCLPRRQKYAYDVMKHIPYHMLEGAFDQFPGSNVETLGYGEL